ncbi:uncharacterized protein PB18E9.04c-like [Cynara cardunculus var. scolymus]|uniref:uncharacterized protein PB18E9.04c-like n=1 Tax=Cynara cardunculus var. scolymus TaxID=59895 RepID=UPI000D623B56|nr:uncharacterized protein PB18E9.04c-like [Cynara cardunculus var. scolymus]
MAKSRKIPTGRLPTLRSTRRAVIGESSSVFPVASAVAPPMAQSEPLLPVPIAFAPPARSYTTSTAGRSTAVRVDYDESHAVVTPVSITTTHPLLTTIFPSIFTIPITTTIGAGPSTSRLPAAVPFPPTTNKPLFLVLTTPPPTIPTFSPIPSPISPPPTQQPPIPLPSTPLGPPTIHDFDLNLSDTLGEEFQFDFEDNASSNLEELFPFSVPETMKEQTQKPQETQTEDAPPAEETPVTAPVGRL